jgi:hypothetical protein
MTCGLCLRIAVAAYPLHVLLCLSQVECSPDKTSICLHIVCKVIDADNKIGRSDSRDVSRQEEVTIFAPTAADPGPASFTLQGCDAASVRQRADVHLAFDQEGRCSFEFGEAPLVLLLYKVVAPPSPMSSPLVRSKSIPFGRLASIHSFLLSSAVRRGSLHHP